jgi:lactate dehydrogenase-like 2-hydroxyacid dehydrogenase
MKKCLVINDREPLPEDHLNDVPELESVWYQKAGSAFSMDEAIAQNPDTQIIVTTYMDWNAARLQQLPQLELVITTTISTHFVDSGYCREHGIQIVNTANYTGASVAEHAVALMMAGMRKIPAIDQQVRQGNTDCFDFPGTELSVKTAGIIGFGNIGAYTAQLLSGFNMQLQFYNRSAKTSPIAKAVDVDTLVETSDVVFLSLPLNNDSRHIINAERLQRMKNTALLVNTSPDDVMDLAAVKAAVLNGDIGGIALDLLNANFFLECPNTILTPRRAWYTNECFTRRIGMWKDTLKLYLSGAQLNNQNAEDFVPINK